MKMKQSWVRRLFRLVLCLLIVVSFSGVSISAPPDEKGEKGAMPAVLVYEVDPQAKSDGPPVDMKKLVAALERRLNPGWLRRARIRELPDGRIEVTVLKTDPSSVARIDRLVLFQGTLEFRITANTPDHRSIVARAKLLGEGETRLLGPKKPDQNKTPLIAWWVPVAEKREGSFPADIFVTRVVKDNGREVTQVLVVNDPFHVTGRCLRRAAAQTDERGRPSVSVSLTSEGAVLFAQLTSLNSPDTVTGFYRNLAIILDGKVYSAPRIQGPISEGALISGDFLAKEARDLADVLNAGPLGTRLRKVANRTNTP